VGVLMRKVEPDGTIFDRLAATIVSIVTLLDSQDGALHFRI
jgi:hypothetical protein